MSLLTETWVTEPDFIDDVLSDYHSIHSVRQSGIADGVAVYISKQFTYPCIQ